MKISKKQYEELCESNFWGGNEDFHELLERYTGIEAIGYIGYSYYDEAGNYIGDSNSDSVRDLLNSAYVEIED